MTFITRSTKTNCIVASVITVLLLITLIMLTSLIEVAASSKVLLGFIYTVSLLLIVLLWSGILQIKVFSDYKCQNPLLCTDGIISICMATLLIICSTLFGVLQASKIFNGTLIQSGDIRFFLSAFLFITSIWKLSIAIIAFKRHYYNDWCEFCFAALWFILGIICLTSIFITGLTVIAWLTISFGWVIIILTTFYMLYSYVLRTPKYLETEKARDIRQKELARQEARRNRSNSLEYMSTKSDIKNKLAHLKELKDNNLISEDEYLAKKSEILEEM